MIPHDRISEIASAKGSAPAIILPDQTIDWNEFRENVGRYINALQEIAKTQSVGNICVISPNRVELIYLASAAASLKLTFFGLDYTQSQNTLRDLMRVSETNVLAISSKAFVELGLDPHDLSAGRPVIDFDNLLSHGVRVPRFPSAVDEIRPAIRPFRAVGFTSGTTGQPKVVLRDKSFDARRFAYFTARYGFSSADNHLVTIPLYHAAGSGWARLFLGLGATLVLPPADDWATAAQMIVTEGVTTSAMTPPIAMSICKELESSHRALVPGRLRFVLVGGKNFSATDKEYCARIMQGAVHEYYGTTETGVNTIADPDDIIARPDTVGKPYDGNDILVVGVDGTPQPPGKAGRIAIHSYMNMAGYAGQAAESISHDGKTYLLTNETGTLGTDGYLRLANRTADVSVSNVYELEDRIKRLPCVSDAAIVCTDKARGKVSCGFVLREGALGTHDGVAKRVRDLMRSERVRGSVAPVESIPYSPSGKVRVHDLEGMIRAVAPSNSGAWLPWVGVLMLAGTAAAWGGMFHIAKSALTSLDAFHVTLVRYGLAALIFLALLWAREGLASLRPGRDLLRLWMFGSLGFAGFSILAFWGLAFTRPEHGAIIMALMPLITAVVLFIWKGASISTVTAACIVAALLGVLMAITNGDLSLLQGGALIPNLTILCGAMCWVIYTIGARSFPGYSVLRYTALSCGLGALTIVAVTALATLFGLIQTPKLAELAAVRFELSYLVLIAGVAAVFSWNTGIRYLGAMNGVLFINLVPITALTFGWLKGHSFSSMELIGGGLTIAALVVNNLNDRGWLQIKRRGPTESRSIATT